MTLDRALLVVTLLAAIGAGLIAGVFFAFSTFVMKALAKRPPAEAIAAMQAINVAVINPIFLGVFLGTVAMSVACVWIAMMRSSQSQHTYAIFGMAFYIIGTVGVTIVRNVPLNDTLATVSATDPGADKLWTTYLKRWTMWNHVRTVASMASAALFILALRG